MNYRARHFRRESSGFTLVEIAICLAVIGIALVGIIGVLPLGMRVQSDNREQTVINQDATVFIEAIRNGSSGLDDLTNYVYQILNTRTAYPSGNTNISSYDSSFLTNGFIIIGLLSTPEFTDSSGNPIYDISGGNYNSNHVVAYVRSMSGPAVEKPPQDNQIIQADAFSYKILCVNAPVATDTNTANLNSPYTKQLEANMHELRLTFQWPILPNGGIGTGRQTFRALVAGQVVQDADNTSLYFYQSQSFTNAP